MKIKKYVSIILLVPFLAIVLVYHIAIAGSVDKTMVKVPGGEFKSGHGGHDLHVKKVKKTFYIDKYEVTNVQFKKFMKEYIFPKGKENAPATEVSYLDAEEYCKSVGKRMPTGHEWEKAARGTDHRTYPWGNDFDSKKANTLESKRQGTATVGSYPGGKSPYGALDMSGNVWEWVDAWSSEEQMYRLVMGGSFFDDKTKATTFSTLRSIEDDVHTYIGFRCAK
tara:strand:- start:7589 stop:8257 length:669 start_codon:yes stop_codon:yes gene_type:complete